MSERASALVGGRPSVQLVCRGYIERDGDRIVEASSSVTLVQAAGKRILVDTGSSTECALLVESLEAIGIKAGEIDIVVNTHLHVDHCGCNELFEKARVVVHALEEPPVGTLRISGGMTLLPGVEIVPTPGHTPGSVSVFVSSDRKYAVCGDAVPTKANYDSHSPPFIACDRKLALKSLEAIVAWAEVIVPGHDSPFEVLGKKYVPRARWE